MKNNISQKIKVRLDKRSYDICIGNNILRELGAKLKSLSSNSKIVIISNLTVYKFHGKETLKSIKSAGLEVYTVLIPDGEKYKNIKTIQYIYTKLLEYKLDRKSILVALGGGVIGDITGFVVSTYMRGIDYVQVPTTLLAQVDSSIGGKTGINHELSKNMIGTFYQPKFVLTDINTLKTLPKREFISGLAEVIKYGVINDKNLFDFLEKNIKKILSLDKKALNTIITRSCKIKAEIVSKDEKESGLRAILNYGHTIGHAVETVTKYKKFLHGEAVAIGMSTEAKLSESMGILKKSEVLKIKSLLNSYSLPTEIPANLDINQLMSSMQLDKKTIAEELSFILPERIGKGKNIRNKNNFSQIKKLLQNMDKTRNLC